MITVLTTYAVIHLRGRLLTAVRGRGRAMHNLEAARRGENDL